MFPLHRPPEIPCRSARLRFAGSVAVLLVGAAIALLACSGGANGVGKAGDTPVRSVLLITIDTLRADRLSCYGYPRPTSPNIDAFAARGTRFDFAFSTSPVTLPSHISILTGRYPSFTSVGVKNGPRILEPQVDTIAEKCAESGIRTAAIVSNFVLRRKLGLDQGFESYDDRLPDREIVRNLPERVAAHTVAEARRALETLGKERHFLWVHFQDPHGPYLPPGEWNSRFEGLPPTVARDRTLAAGRDQGGFQTIPSYQTVDEERRMSDYVNRYDAEIAYLDDRIGALFDSLVESGRLENTLVVLTSDHGESMGENDYFFAHGHAVSIDQTRVPLLFVGPGIEAGRVVTTAVSNISIYATILNALGIDDSGRIEQSDSLWPSLIAGTEPEAAAGFAESATQRAVFFGDTYFHRDEMFEGENIQWGLPHPESGVVYQPAGRKVYRFGSAGSPDMEDVKRLQSSLDGYARIAERVRSTTPPATTFTLTEEEKAALRALGYLPEED
jgi:arylsulfatase A-like enzyme